MDKDLTELVFIIDRSGSMGGLETDTIGGFNSTIAKQREEPGRALVSTALFDDRYELLHDRVPLEHIHHMTDKQYYVRGSTALLDAMGRTIEDITGKRHAVPKEQRPGKTIFVVITDGLENASTRWTADQVRHLVEKKQSKGWEFLFLGANMDAIAEAGKLGISSDRAVTYLCDADGTDIAYGAVACAMSSIRQSKTRVGGDWKGSVERDARKRGGHAR